MGEKISNIVYKSKYKEHLEYVTYLTELGIISPDSFLREWKEVFLKLFNEGKLTFSMLNKANILIEETEFIKIESEE